MYSTASLRIYETRKIRRWRELNPVPHGTTVGYSKTNKVYLCRELNPDPHAQKSVRIRRELSSLDFSE